MIDFKGTYGALGKGNEEKFKMEEQKGFARVFLPQGTKFKSVQAVDGGVLALDQDSKVWGWGKIPIPSKEEPEVAPEQHQSEYRIKGRHGDYNMTYHVNIESENLKIPEGQSSSKWTGSFSCDGCGKNLRDEPWGYVCRNDNWDLCGACAT
jgi:hypothetical protein